MRRNLNFALLILFATCFCSACQSSDPTTGPEWAGVPRPSGAEARRMTDLYWYDPDGYDAYLAEHFPQVLENERRLAAEANEARRSRPKAAPVTGIVSEPEWTAPRTPENEWTEPEPIAPDWTASSAPIEPVVVEHIDPPTPAPVFMREPEPWTEPEPVTMPASIPVETTTEAPVIADVTPVVDDVYTPVETIEPRPEPSELPEIAQNSVRSFKGIAARERSRPGTQAVWAWAAGVQMVLRAADIDVHPEYIVASNYDGMVRVPDFRVDDIAEKFRIRSPGGKITVESTMLRGPMNPLEIIETIDRGQLIMIVFGPEHPSGRPVHPIIVHGYRVDAFGETNLLAYDPWPSVAQAYEERLSAVSPHWRETILIEGNR